MSGIFDFLVVNAFLVVFSGNPDFGAHTQTHPTFSCGKELGAGGAVSVYFHVYATT